jgi:hypothetical protein
VYETPVNMMVNSNECASLVFLVFNTVLACSLAVCNLNACNRRALAEAAWLRCLAHWRWEVSVPGSLSTSLVYNW